jgi:uncharacterized protein YxjI
MHPKIVIEQKITAFTNQYRIYASEETGTKGKLLAFAQQKRIALKEKITFYSNEDKTEAIFSFRAEKVMDVHGRYLIEDTSGAVIGMFKKEFARSLINSTWNILDAKGEPKIRISESNQTLAIIRRVGGMIPFVGEIVELVTTFLRYHFVFKSVATGEVVGTYQKTTLFRDHYLLSATEEMYTQEDWRVLASVGVALDALQSR